MFRELDLSEDQKKNLDSIWQHFNGQRKILEESMDNNRIRMFGVMMDEKLDTARYEELSENQANLIRELNDTMLAMNRQIRANLSEGQQKVLTEKMQEIRTRRMPRERRNRRSK
jgi:Spy/CpxP family protein refolding chaperone